MCDSGIVEAEMTGRRRSSDHGSDRRASRSTPCGARRIVESKPLDPAGHANDAYIVTFDDGTRRVYKLIAGEDANLRQGIVGGLAHRAAAASRWMRRSVSAEYHDRHGRRPARPGSVQQWVVSTPHREHYEYPRVQ
ncbi:MAG: hypothetical protein ACJ72N_24985 [Labedaea sp.]